MELGQEKEGRGLRKGMSTKGEIISLKDFKEDRDLFRVEEKPFTGVWVDYYDYENGQKEYEGHYKDGKLNGLYVEWYEDGQKVYEGYYEDGIEVDALWTELDENEALSPRSASEKFIVDVCFPVLVFCLPAFVFLGVGFSVYFLGIWIVELIGPNPDSPNTEFATILLGIKSFSLLKA